MVKYYILLYLAAAFLIAFKRGMKRNTLACGLWGGFSSSLTNNERNTIKTIGVLSLLRGEDSTGVCVGYKIANNRAYHITKELGNSVDFLGVDRVKKAFDVSQAYLYMGHSRSATIGEVNVENAHPHKIDHIIGCHNGTIHSLTKTTEGRSDSYSFFKILAKEGLQEALNRAEYGAYALSYVSTKDRTLNFLRNSQRPLWFAYNKSSTTIYWASEPDMLMFSANRCSVEIQKPFQIPVDVLHTLPTSAATLEFKTTPFKRKEHNSSFSSGSYEDWYRTHPTRERVKFIHGKRHVYNEQTGVWDEQEDPPAEKATPVKAIPFDPFPDDPKETRKYRIGKLRIPYSSACRLLSKGCCMCNKICSINELAYWVTRTDYYCPTCRLKDEGEVIKLFFDDKATPGNLIQAPNEERVPPETTELPPIGLPTTFH